MIARSHSCYAEINQDRELRFFFDNIMLPDSSANLEGSNGFITFTFDQVVDLPNGTLIENHADIFFDFNDPIRTNTTRHTIDDGLINVSDIESLPFSISPNPVDDVVYIKLNKGDMANTLVNLFTITGQKILDSQMLSDNHQLNVGHLDEGIYLIRLTDDQGRSSSKKLVIR